MEKRTKARKTRNERNRMDEGCLRPLSRSKKWNTWYSRFFFLSWYTEKVVSLCMPRNRINLGRMDSYKYLGRENFCWLFLYLFVFIYNNYNNFIIGLFILYFGFIKKSWIVYLISMLYLIYWFSDIFGYRFNKFFQ